MTLVQHGPKRYQNKSGPFTSFAEKGHGRSFSKKWFNKVSINGEIVERKWLLYSPYRDTCYCFACCLFSNEQQSSLSNFSQDKAFSTCRKLNPRIPDHKKNPSHRAHIREYLTLVSQLKRSTMIDAELQQQMSAMKKKWRAISERIVEVISFLAKQNLALRGHR